MKSRYAAGEPGLEHSSPDLARAALEQDQGTPASDIERARVSLDALQPPVSRPSWQVHGRTGKYEALTADYNRQVGDFEKEKLAKGQDLERLGLAQTHELAKLKQMADLEKEKLAIQHQQQLERDKLVHEHKLAEAAHSAKMLESDFKVATAKGQANVKAVQEHLTGLPGFGVLNKETQEWSLLPELAPIFNKHKIAIAKNPEEGLKAFLAEAEPIAKFKGIDHQAGWLQAATNASNAGRKLSKEEFAFMSTPSADPNREAQRRTMLTSLYHNQPTGGPGAAPVQAPPVLNPNLKTLLQDKASSPTSNSAEAAVHDLRQASSPPPAAPAQPTAAQPQAAPPNYYARPFSYYMGPDYKPGLFDLSREEILQRQRAMGLTDDQMAAMLSKPGLFQASNEELERRRRAQGLTEDQMRDIAAGRGPTIPPGEMVFAPGTPEPEKTRLTKAIAAAKAARDQRAKDDQQHEEQWLRHIPEPRVRTPEPKPVPPLAPGPQSSAPSLPSLWDLAKWLDLWRSQQDVDRLGQVTAVTGVRG
jgi:hypothetical protein